MGLEINIASNILDVAARFKEIETKLLYASVRHSINRTLPYLRLQSINKLRTKIDIKPSVLRAKHIAMTKARGTSWRSLQGVLSFNTNPIPMIEFVKGSKEPIKQKGIKIKKRRVLRVQIVPGKKFVLKKAFIQKVKTKQVFKRKEGGASLHKQGIRSVGFIVMSRGVGNELQVLGARRFRDLFVADIKARIAGHVGKVRDPR